VLHAITCSIFAVCTFWTSCALQLSRLPKPCPPSPALSTSLRGYAAISCDFEADNLEGSIALGHALIRSVQIIVLACSDEQPSRHAVGTRGNSKMQDAPPHKAIHLIWLHWTFQQHFQGPILIEPLCKAMDHTKCYVRYSGCAEATRLHAFLLFDNSRFTKQRPTPHTLTYLSCPCFDHFP
jgi:hypothetical protein